MRKPGRAVLRAAVGGMALAAALLSHAQPLTRPEFDAVLGEIQAMLKTDENDVTRFVAREATPERIERFYATPEAAALPENLRANGLIFGGLGGKLLAFDRPSDVLAKVERWFPAELADARKHADSAAAHIDIRLWGPYENWQPEPTAFVALWKCFPQSAWMRPGRQPFARSARDWQPMVPWAVRRWRHLYPYPLQVDFAQCVREASGYRPPDNEQGLPRQRAIAAGIGERAIPPLVEHFARFLQRDACRGTGPDDCVLVLNAWANLRAADPALARALQSLEAQVAPDAPLPAPRVHVAAPRLQYVDESAEETVASFNAGLRIGGFLQAKLRSVLGVPQAWPADALARTFAQMTRLHQQMAAAYAKDDGAWGLAQNPSANPWRALGRPPATPAVVDAMLHELERIAPDPDCAVHATWFRYGGAELRTRFVQQQQAAHLPVRCGQVAAASSGDAASPGAQAPR